METIAVFAVGQCILYSNLSFSLRCTSQRQMKLTEVIVLTLAESENMWRHLYSIRFELIKVVVQENVWRRV